MSTIASDGPHLIQHIGLIIVNDVAAMGGAPDWPGDDFVYDPSSPGNPSSWPPVLFNPDGTPTSPAVPPYGRLAGGPDGTPAKRRKGGSGHPPAPNVLTRADAYPGPHKCYAGIIQARIDAPAHPAWDGLEPAVFGVLCAPYNPPTIPGPVTAYVMKTIADPPYAGLPVGACPVGTLLPDVIARFLTLNVGVDSTAVVIRDQYAGPGPDCTVGGATCGGSVGSGDPVGTSLGAVITPA